jgi:hypothetical protein
MSVSFVLVGSQIKRFKTVVKSLAAIGGLACQPAAQQPPASHQFEPAAAAVVPQALNS